MLNKYNNNIQFGKEFLFNSNPNVQLELCKNASQFEILNFINKSFINLTSPVDINEREGKDMNLGDLFIYFPQLFECGLENKEFLLRQANSIIGINIKEFFYGTLRPVYNSIKDENKNKVFPKFLHLSCLLLEDYLKENIDKYIRPYSNRNIDILMYEPLCYMQLFGDLIMSRNSKLISRIDIEKGLKSCDFSVLDASNNISALVEMKNNRHTTISKHCFGGYTIEKVEEKIKYLRGIVHNCYKTDMNDYEIRSWEVITNTLKSLEKLYFYNKKVLKVSSWILYVPPYDSINYKYLERSEWKVRPSFINALNMISLKEKEIASFTL